MIIRTLYVWYFSRYLGTYIHTLKQTDIYTNKAITMMRGKSPRSDVEMTKKLNFLAAILDFWRVFLNQFWPNLIHTYKIHFWISFVLCVVFKCQYFWSYSRKKPFFTIYIHISKGRNSLKDCSIDHIFFYRFRTFQLRVFVLCVVFKCE